MGASAGHPVVNCCIAFLLENAAARKKSIRMADA